MSILDYLQSEYLTGKVEGKYRLKNGNVGIVLYSKETEKRCHVEFKDDYKGPAVKNLYGVLRNPFAGKTNHLDKLIHEGDHIKLNASYSKGPFREAYRLCSSIMRISPNISPCFSMVLMVTPSLATRILPESRKYSQGS